MERAAVALSCVERWCYLQQAFSKRSEEERCQVTCQKKKRGKITAGIAGCRAAVWPHAMANCMYGVYVHLAFLSPLMRPYGLKVSSCLNLACFKCVLPLTQAVPFPFWNAFLMRLQGVQKVPHVCPSAEMAGFYKDAPCRLVTTESQLSGLTNTEDWNWENGESLRVSGG